MQKMRLRKKKIHICSEFPENLKANRGKTFLIAPMDQSVKLWEQLFWPFQAYFSNVQYYFLTGFESKLSLMTDHLLQKVAFKWSNQP